MMPPSLYIHIPFCRSKCPYCGFYSVIYDTTLACDYVNGIIKQAEGIEGKVSTIYIGGGTPTVLEAGILKELLRGLKRFTGDDIEFTVEANPESLDKEKLKLLLDAGVNRLSIGVQSLDDRKLRKLGRIHTAPQAAEAVALSNKAGFDNISADLIFGVWAETLDDWRSELDETLKLPLKHISCYSLTYEENSALFTAKERGDLLPLEDEVAAQMYEYALAHLPAMGFTHYEVSNFAKDGYLCRHNLNYWDNNSYIGLGASAVSHINGVRAANVLDIKKYLNRQGYGEDLVASSEKLSQIERSKETAAVKIRTREGIDFGWFSKKTGFDLCELEKDVLPALLEKGLIEYKAEDKLPCGIRLTGKGFLFCDIVSSELL